MVQMLYRLDTDNLRNFLFDIGFNALFQSHLGHGASAAGAGPGEASPVAAMELPSQIQEFVERLDQELKDVHPSTLIAVFGLGVLIGWILPR